MKFRAWLVDRSARNGHYLLKDVQAENGMRRGHMWLNSARDFLGALPFPSEVEIEGRIHEYDGKWNISGVKSCQVI